MERPSKHHTRKTLRGGGAGMVQGEAEEIGVLAFSRSRESVRKLQWKAPSENQNPAQMLLEQEGKDSFGEARIRKGAVPHGGAKGAPGCAARDVEVALVTRAWRAKETQTAGGRLLWETKLLMEGVGGLWQRGSGGMDGKDWPWPWGE